MWHSISSSAATHNEPAASFQNRSCSSLTEAPAGALIVSVVLLTVDSPTMDASASMSHTANQGVVPRATS